MISIDLNEPKEVRNYFSEHKLCRLNCDYLINDVAIERKTFSDFLQSLYNGRLFNQLLKTKSVHEKTILVIESLIDPALLINPKIFYSTTQYITLKLGIPIVFSQSLENTVEVLKMLCSTNDGIFFYRKIKILPKKISITEKMLRCIDGVGPKRARRIIEKYKTIANIIKTENISSEGVNNKLIEKVKRELK